MLRSPSRIFWILLGVFILLSRVPVAAKYLSIDNVNLAYSLEKFDPRIHQPQPPGYPFFVLFAKVINFVVRDPEITFLFISVLVSFLSLVVIYELGSRMFEPWVGEAAAWLLAVNPVFWFSALDGPLRPFLALFSLLSGYCAWRAWHRETRFVYWGAAALGVGSGIRPDLLVYLGPVWLVSTLVGPRSIRKLLIGGVVFAFVCLIWIGGLVYAVGGPSELYGLLRSYLVEQSQGGSMVLGAATQGWVDQVKRLITWNSLAVLEWIWAVPLFLASKERVSLISTHTVFLKIWVLPGLIAQALIHVAAPGHTLFSIPVFCLIGAYVLRVGLKRWGVADAGLIGAVAASLMLFLHFIPLPSADSWGGPWDGFSVMTFETSLENIRWLDDIHGSTLREIRNLTTPDRKTIIVTLDMARTVWFLNWRIARYYLPDAEIRILVDHKRPPETFQVRGSKTGQVMLATDIPVPLHSRLLWVLDTGGPLHSALSKANLLHGGPRVFYTDIDDMTPFSAGDFRIVPQP
jgi:hypothetical protein